MKTKLLTVLLCISLTATLFVGCGSSANTENSNEAQTGTTEVTTEKTVAGFVEDPYAYFNVSFGDYQFNLVDADAVAYEELSEQLVSKDWANQVEMGAAAAMSGKHRFNYGTNVYLHAEENRYTHFLTINFSKKEIANLEFELYGGIRQDTPFEELVKIWGEPDYSIENSPIYYYVSPCGKYYIEIFYPETEERTGIYRVTFYYSEEINCYDYFKVYADPENEKEVVMWIQPGMVDSDYRTGTYTKDMLFKNTEVETEAQDTVQEAVVDEYGITTIVKNTEKNSVSGMIPEYVEADAGIAITRVTVNGYEVLDYNGVRIVPDDFYSKYKLSNDGQVALCSRGKTLIYDSEGNCLAEFNDMPFDPGTTIHVNDNCVVYSLWNKVVAYDLTTKETWFEATGNDMGTTAYEDGAFYYSSEGTLYKVSKDGTSEKISSVGDMKFESAFEDGYTCLVPTMFGNVIGFYNKDTNKVVKADMEVLSDLYLGKSYQYSAYREPVYYYDNGLTKHNNGAQFLWAYRKNNQERYCLVDISRASVGSDGMLEMTTDMILADYPYIALSDCGYYLASDGNWWFYIDETGKEVGPTYIDCSAFYSGYAVAIDYDDGKAYMIDTNFEKVSKGYPADRVYTAGGMFVIEKGEEKTLLAPPQK